MSRADHNRVIRRRTGWYGNYSAQQQQREFLDRIFQGDSEQINAAMGKHQHKDGAPRERRTTVAAGPDDGQVLAEFTKHDGVVRLSLRTFNGRQYLDVRKWYQPDGSDEWRPTKQGVSLSVEQLPEVRDALARAEDLVA